MQLILGSFILAKIRELITEVIEIFDELFKLFLLSVRSMNEFKVLLLDVVETSSHSLSLHTNLSEHFLHLTLISVAQLLPDLKNSGLEITVDVSDTRLLGRHTFGGRFGSLNLCLFFLSFATFGTFLFSLLALFLFFSSDAESLCLGSLILIESCIDPLL
jgi:hypothetical protein